MTAPAAPRLSVVIPAFNEADRIAGSLRAITDYLARQDYSSEVVVVDDGSRDATPRIVAELARERPAIRLLSIAHAGKGGAVRAGMLAARGELLYMCDTDLSTPIEEIERFLAACRDCDVAIGSREATGSIRIDEPWRRHALGRVFNRIVKVLVLPRIEDSQCGFKLFRAAPARELFARQTLDGFGFDVELLFLARRLGLDVREVPVTWRYQPGSKVKPLRDALRMLRDVVRVRWNALRGAYSRPAEAGTASAAAAGAGSSHSMRKTT